MTSNTRRWMIVATLFVAIVCNYLDRQLLSVLKPEILQHFGIGNIEYAWIVNVFLVCYAVMYPVSGLLVDRFGPKRVMLGGIVTWSLACVGGGLCGPGQVALFTVFRGILGLAEPTVFASQFIAVTLWFARRERATANSLCQNGGAIGAVLAPITIAALMGWLDAWQHVFFIAGVTGLVIAAVWAFVYRTPAPDVLAQTTDAAGGTDSVPAFPLRRLLRTRTLWGGVLIRLVSDPVWYFCCFWLPGFLRRMGEREGLTNAQTLSMIQWIGGLPFLVGAIGAVLASVWSDGMIRRGAPALRARKTVLAFMVILAPACALVPFVDGSALPFGWRVGLVVAAFCLIAVLCNSWLHTIPVTLIEQVPVRNGAFVSGCSCGAGAVGTVVFNQFVGTIPESAWTVLFCAMATFHALAAVILWKMVRPETAKEQEDAGTS